jgi:ribosome-binding factor A
LEATRSDDETISRTRRVGEQIRRELADLIRAELRDPRLTLISMTSVEVSRDLAYARIYVTLMGDPAERAERVAELNRAAPLSATRTGSAHAYPHRAETGIPLRRSG